MKGKAGLNLYIPPGGWSVPLSSNQKKKKKKSPGWANIKHSPVLSPVTFFDIQATYVIALQGDQC